MSKANKTKKKPKEKITLIYIIKEIVETIVFVVVALVLIKFFFLELRWIPSSSMYPTLKIKDRLVVERFSRFYSTPKRGDIMVFYPPEEELKNDVVSLFTRYTGIGCKDIAYIKRVVGVPGDKIEIKKNAAMKYQVFINDTALKEPYVNKELPYIQCDKTKYCGPLVLPEKKYFMLGDNRGNSQDSRFWGSLNEDRFIGRAVYIYWPVNRTRIIFDPKYNLPPNENP